MPRYELGDKFFEIDWSSDTSFHVRFGKLGQAPTEATRKHASRAEAEKAWAKKVSERVKKGYAPVGGSAPPAKKKAKIASSPDVLERAIDDDPDDLAALQVYADRLHEQGDPRGELVSLSLAKGPKAKKAYAAHLEAHAAVLLGALAEDEALATIVWKHGFIRELEVDLAHAELFDSIVSLPTMRFLTRLKLGVRPGDGDNELGPHWKSLAAAGLAALREVVVEIDGDDLSFSSADLGDFSMVWAACPRLEKVWLQGSHLTLGKIVAPALRELSIVSAGLGRAAVKSVAAATLPKLEKLDLWLGRTEYGGDSEVGDVAPILDGVTRLPALRELGLCNAPYTDAIASRLPKARIVKQLRTIDLSMGTMRSEGAQALVAGARALAHLEKLGLEQNLVEKDDVQALQKAFGKSVAASSQRQFYDWMIDDEGVCRYTAIGE